MSNKGNYEGGFYTRGDGSKQPLDPETLDNTVSLGFDRATGSDFKSYQIKFTRNGKEETIDIVMPLGGIIYLNGANVDLKMNGPVIKPDTTAAYQDRDYTLVVLKQALRRWKKLLGSEGQKSEKSLIAEIVNILNKDVASRMEDQQKEFDKKLEAREYELYTLNKPMYALTLEKAVQFIRHVLETDDSYSNGWKSNIAMCFYDAMMHYEFTEKFTPEDLHHLHIVCNQAAEKFVNLFTDTSPDASENWGSNTHRNEAIAQTPKIIVGFGVGYKNGKPYDLLANGKVIPSPEVKPKEPTLDEFLTSKGNSPKAEYSPVCKDGLEEAFEAANKAFQIVSQVLKEHAEKRKQYAEKLKAASMPKRNRYPSGTRPDSHGESGPELVIEPGFNFRGNTLDSAAIFAANATEKITQRITDAIEFAKKELLNNGSFPTARDFYDETANHAKEETSQDSKNLIKDYPANGTEVLFFHSYGRSKGHIARQAYAQNIQPGSKSQKIDLYVPGHLISYRQIPYRDYAAPGESFWDFKQEETAPNNIDPLVYGQWLDEHITGETTAFKHPAVMPIGSTVVFHYVKRPGDHRHHSPIKATVTGYPLSLPENDPYKQLNLELDLWRPVNGISKQQRGVVHKSVARVNQSFWDYPNELNTMPERIIKNPQQENLPLTPGQKLAAGLVQTGQIPNKTKSQLPRPVQLQETVNFVLVDNEGVAHLREAWVKAIRANGQNIDLSMIANGGIDKKWNFDNVPYNVPGNYCTVSHWYFKSPATDANQAPPLTLPREVKKGERVVYYPAGKGAKYVATVEAIKIDDPFMVHLIIDGLPVENIGANNNLVLHVPFANPKDNPDFSYWYYLEEPKEEPAARQTLPKFDDLPPVFIGKSVYYYPTGYGEKYEAVVSNVMRKNRNIVDLIVIYPDVQRAKQYVPYGNPESKITGACWSFK